MKNTNDDHARDLKQTVRYVTQNLEAAYGVPRPEPHSEVLDELIGTVLSQSTSDVNSRRAFESLKTFLIKGFPNSGKLASPDGSM